ncbi:MAG: S-layer homology domain-containing protein, partial [Acidimicrobiia bacterium]|nr:S-layer homology domain-containing protein [Acidimicrobiia bacterium]
MRRRAATITTVLGSVAALLIGTVAGAATPAEGGRFWDDDGWTHEGNIEAIAAIGVTQGCAPEGTAFCPDLSVTRAQMASFLARALNLTGSNTNRFTDVPGDNVHLGNINAIAAEGITLGCSADGTRYCPNSFVSRAQMASFLARA